ncbi:hypothetical protein V7659_20195 [Neobacillus drentensis]|uniref:hypothetical protein n=1 Tax=Neobacillus drentensis TaxID=220684 RepID=UPI002FFDB33E
MLKKCSTFFDCYSSFIDLNKNFLFCTSPGAHETGIYKFDIGKNDWDYTQDGSGYKKAKVVQVGKKSLNLKGVLGCDGEDNLTFQTFDENLEPISEELLINFPISETNTIKDTDFTIETEDDKFIFWYKYSYKGKRALAKYVIAES